MQAGLIGVIAALGLGAAAPASAAPLRFSITEGLTRNAFLQDGPVAAHLVLTARPRVRLLVAFPAGNSGAAIWFAPTERPVRWGPIARLRAAKPPSPALHGITADLSADAPQLEIKQALVGGVRSLRDYEDNGALAPVLLAKPEVSGQTISWARDRLDGAAGYNLSVTVLAGRLEAPTGGPLRLVAPPHGRLKLRVTAFTGETPLTPIPARDLLTPAAAGDRRLADALAFLTYDEKMLAGSWRFDTYFGRDTLMSVRLLSQALSPRASEAALGAVLARVNAAGEVAHEEEIGDYAVLQRLLRNQPPSAEPRYDYRPVDGAYMLAPVLAHYLLETPAGRERAAAFLARPGVREALLRNVHWVMAQAAPFADHPEAKALIALKPGIPVGEWRDSLEGLGHGRYPYDVDAVLVPAALQAIARLAGSGLLDGADPPPDPGHDLAARAEAMAKAWMEQAPPLFEVSLDAEAARQAVTRYARAIGVDPDGPAAALGPGPLRFHALALNAAGRPIPVLHSDEGFALLFLEPDPADLEVRVETLMRPFPAGLMTGAGMVVADAAYADERLQPLFDNSHYHGAVVWSWQQALFIAGLDRQLERRDLPAGVRATLRDARRRLWAVVEATRPVRNSELWSWSYKHRRYRIEPFGQRGADKAESDAAQLWSTVYLGLRQASR